MPLKNTTITTQVIGGETKLLGAADTPAVFPETNPLLASVVTLTSGTGSARAEKVGMASFSLTGGAHVDLDLQSFPGPFGDIAFTSVKWGAIDNKSTLAGDVIEHGDAPGSPIGAVASPWVGPYGGSGRGGLAEPSDVVTFPARLNGWAVSGGSRYWRLRNTNTGTNVATGNVILIGEGS